MRPDTLARLRNLRKAARDRASRELAAARTAESRVQAQREMLARYGTGYSVRHATAVTAGIPVVLLRNHSGFAAQLRAAMTAADQRVAAAASAVMTKAAAWRAEEQRLLAYDTLCKRQAISTRRTDARAEQRRLDAKTNAAAARARVRGGDSGSFP